MPSATELRISRARTHLLLDQPWFGMLALRLRIQETPQIPTMANDGSVLHFNEAFVATLSDKQLIGTLAHEVMHCAMGHMWRGKGRDWHRWNIAADIAINQLLRAQGFELPETELAQYEKKYPNMSAEQIYALWEMDNPPSQKMSGKGGQSDSQQGQGQDGSGQGDDDCFCGLQPAPDPNAAEAGNGEEIMSETDWQIAAEEATTIVKKAGKLPAHIDRAIRAIERTKVDWRTILRRFIENVVPSDYSWTTPNRRFISQGLYLPGMVKENTPRIALGVDTSGSVDQQMLNLFASELTSILHEVRPESLDVVYCDAVVQGRESFSPDDGAVVLHAKGGGGTAFQPVIDLFNNDPLGEPACMIYLTDLYGPEPTKPNYPVLWAIPEQYSQQTPWWGEKVVLSKWD